MQPLTTLLPVGVDRRIANEIYRRRFQGRGSQPIEGRVGGAKMRLDLVQWPEAQAYLLGRYDPSTVQYALSRLPRSGVMIDGGAHVGLITFQVWARRPDVQIHAFEPHPFVAARFCENLALREGANITLNEVGLSDQAGSLPFDFDTHSSHHGNATGMIDVIRLDDYMSRHRIDRVDVLKLDIEGHELVALRGAKEALAAGRVRSVIVERIEDHGPLAPVHDLLKDAGLRRVEMPDPRFGVMRRLRPQTNPENVAYELDPEPRFLKPYRRPSGVDASAQRLARSRTSS